MHDPHGTSARKIQANKNEAFTAYFRCHVNGIFQNTNVNGCKHILREDDRV